MEYNKQEQIEKNYKDFIINKKYIYKKNIKNNTNSLLILQNKITELQNKLEFYKKYENKINCNDVIIENSIEVIDQLIFDINKNIISKGQFNRNCKYIEFEF